MGYLHFLCIPILGSVGMTWLLQETEEKGKGRLSIGQRVYYLFYIFIMVLFLFAKAIRGEENIGLPLNWCTGGVFACILVCALTDLKSRWIYDIVIIMGFIFCSFEKTWYGAEVALIKEWVAYSLIQVVIFRRFYGDGDVELFLLCGFLNLLSGGGIFKGLSFMFLVFFILGVHQLMRKNINRAGNLKEKVPLAPYIGMASILFYL